MLKNWSNSVKTGIQGVSTSTETYTCNCFFQRTYNFSLLQGKTIVLFKLSWKFYLVCTYTYLKLLNNIFNT